MLKKIGGYLFYLIGVLLTLGVIFISIPIVFSSFLTKEFSYILGQLLGLFFTVFIIYTLFKYGRKWTKK
jgi:hypothetical protein